MKLLTGTAPQVAQGLLARCQQGRALVVRGIARGAARTALLDELERAFHALNLNRDELVTLVWDGTPEAVEALGELNRARDLLLQSARLVLLVAEDEAGLRFIQDRAVDLLAYLELGFEVHDDQSRPSISGTVGPVRILHLSDLHARTRPEWEARSMLPRLVETVAILRDAGRGPDVIAITGDLAGTGQAAEYALVESWLKDRLLPSAGLDTDALLIVPGNHDVDRNATGSGTITALEEQLTLGDEQRFAEVLGDPALRGLLHRRYKPYLAFLERSGVAHPAEPTWALRKQIRGVSAHFIGLDTALLASGDRAHGRLVVGLAALNAVLPPARRDDTEIVVALGHHPMTWLVDWDQQAVVPALSARAHLLLRGHLHNRDGNLPKSAQQGMVELAGGALYQGYQAPLGFHVVELAPVARQGKLSSYAWSPIRHRWIPHWATLRPAGPVTFGLAP